MLRSRSFQEVKMRRKGGKEKAAGMQEAGEGERDPNTLNEDHEESLALNANHVERMGDDPGSKGNLDSPQKKKEQRIEELQKKNC